MRTEQEEDTRHSGMFEQKLRAQRNMKMKRGSTLNIEFVPSELRAALPNVQSCTSSTLHAAATCEEKN